MRKVTGDAAGRIRARGRGVRGVACRARLLRSNVHVLCARRMTDAAAAAPFDPSDPAIGDLTVSLCPPARPLPRAHARARARPAWP